MVFVLCSGGCGASVSMPVSGVSTDFKYVCVNCTPKSRADATGVPRTEITPEIKKRIEETLASPPTVSSRTETTEVETAEGVKTIKVDSDPDDATDICDRSKEPRKRKQNVAQRRSSAPPKREPTRQPAYLKSVAQPLVPSNNPLAPYGYDDNDRPIGVIVPKPSYAPTNLPKSNQPPEPHKFSGNNIQVGNLAPGGHDGGHGAGYQIVSVISESEATLRQLFGERIPADTIVLKPSKNHHEFVDYLKLFHLTRTDIEELLNTQVDILRVEDVLDTTQPKQKVLKSFATMRGEINTTVARIVAANKRITEIVDLVKESESLIDSWSIHKMKLQVKRGERQPDDILDSATREKFKREEKQKIDQLEEERSNLRQQLKTDNRLLVGLQEHLKNWGLLEEDYDEVHPRVTREYPVHFRDKFVPPDCDGFKGILPSGYDYGTDAFLQLVHIYSGVDSAFKGWRRFENELVLQAIGFGLIQPSRALLEKHPTLTTYIDRDAAAMNAEPEDIDPDDDMENALIFKTGGACIGSSIHSGGTRWDGTQRSLSSFNGPIGRGAGFTAGSGDRDADESENSDGYTPD
jgi:hypothetical protein